MKLPSYAREIDKLEMFKKNKYRYNYDMEIYFKREDKKLFSFQYLENISAFLLKEKLGEKNESNEWRFYVKGKVSDSVRKSIIKRLEKLKPPY